MNTRIDVELTTARQTLDKYVAQGFVSMQKSVDSSHMAGAGAMISNFADRPPLLSSGKINEIAKAFDLPVDVQILKLVDESVLRVRPQSTYVTSLGLDPRSGGTIVLLNNKWF